MKKTTKTQKITQLDVVIADRIKQRRIILGLKQKELADFLNVSIQQCQKYEAGENRLSGSKLFNLTKIFKVPVSYFFDGLEREPEKDIETKEADNIMEKDVMNLVTHFRLIPEMKLRRGLINFVKELY